MFITKIRNIKMSVKKTILFSLFLSIAPSFLYSVGDTLNELVEIQKSLILGIQSQNKSQCRRALERLVNLEGVDDGPGSKAVEVVSEIINVWGALPFSIDLSNGVEEGLDDSFSNFSNVGSGEGKFTKVMINSNQ